MDPPPRLEVTLLQLCRQIHDEAAPVLYGKNAFYFSIPKSCARVGFSTEPADELRLRAQSLWLFGYREHSWHTLFLELQASLFARFLHSIGRENAARFTTLRFLLDKLVEGKYDANLTVDPAVNVVMQLLKIHVSGPRDLGVVLMIYDKYEKLVGAFCNPWTVRPMVELVVYDVLRHSVERLSGLKRLWFRGFDRDPNVKRELEK